MTTRGGREVDVRFAGSDRENFYVESPTGVVAIRRREVVDVDHPGDAAQVVGVVLAGYGALNIAVGVDDCDKQGAAFCAGVFLPAILGVSMLIWGAAVHSGSVSAMERRPPPWLGPLPPLRPVQPTQTRRPIAPAVPPASPAAPATAPPPAPVAADAGAPSGSDLQDPWIAHPWVPSPAGSSEAPAPKADAPVPAPSASPAPAPPR